MSIVGTLPESAQAWLAEAMSEDLSAFDIWWGRCNTPDCEHDCIHIRPKIAGGGMLHCDDCREKFYVRERAEAARERRRTLLENHWLHADVFRHTFASSRRDFEQADTKAYADARAWHQTENVYIHGGQGSGKTFISHCLLNVAFAAGRHIGETNAHVYCEGFHGFGKDHVHDWMLGPDVLLIDDVHIGDWSTRSLSALQTLIDHRRRLGRLMIMTCNYNSVELTHIWETAAKSSKIGQSILDRMKPCLDIAMYGRSLRDEEDV